MTFNAKEQVPGRSIGRLSRSILSVVLVILTQAMLSGCDNIVTPDDPEYSDDPCSPNYPDFGETDGFGIIGPDGGTVEVTDPDDPLYGVSVSVPTGSWSACWEVGITYTSIFSTPDYPDGYVPFERPMPTGAVELHIFRWTPDTAYDAPDSMYVEVSFPLQRLQRNDLELYSAFFVDAAQTTWRIKFPDNVADSVLTVQTRAWRRQWSWGRVDLAEIDFEEHLEPALEDRVGTETWNEIKATVDSVYEAAMRATWEPITCIALDFAEGLFLEFQNYSKDMVNAIQGSIPCGGCDATTMAFYQELVQYVRLNIEYMIVEMFTDAVPGRAWPLKLAGFAMMGSLLAAMEALECDYECLVKRAPPPFYVYTAGYWFSYLVVEGIRWFRDSDLINCSPPATSLPLRAGWPGPVSGAVRPLGVTPIHGACSG
jgi:hypothetical protein